MQDKSQVEYETGVQDKSHVEDETRVEDNVDVEDKDEAEVVDSEEDDGEFVDSNEGPASEAPGKVSLDGEHSLDFDTESEGDEDDMEWDNEGTSKPIISVDACHLKAGPYSGQILTVVGVDGNNNLFPIAYAVAEIENKDSWIWFLSLLIEDLEYRMCVRHLYNNFRATHLGLTLKHMLWAAARATTITWWEAEIEKMKEDDLEAWKWLVHRPPNNWTRSHFHPRYKCDLLLNNLYKSFNTVIIDARDNSILTCLESIRMYVMLRIANPRAT
ncbi:hypothetical protein L3X38_022310 [Prunus dulcis]|uniref:MULE transposase domain-containing protein n=1 Tax=Prunus dulcis TaxID=3755 RepID=A0AAD4Z492_PRUDU|nr:hypothetical protein L3X38_022310 [Prunus dulcis]